jgi:hypothetical protein
MSQSQCREEGGRDVLYPTTSRILVVCAGLSHNLTKNDQTHQAPMHPFFEAAQVMHFSIWVWVSSVWLALSKHASVCHPLSAAAVPKMLGWHEGIFKLSTHGLLDQSPS